MASDEVYPPPANAEGFICPVCHFMAKDGLELADHFEREHEEPSIGHKARLQNLSHQNLALDTFTPPTFGHQVDCRICHVSFGYSRTRHHCRNCGNSICGPHSRNSIALPHFGYTTPVRVCDSCYDTITSERQGTTSTSSQGVVMSGKLLKGPIEVLVKLTHLSLSLFNIAEDGSEDAGKNIATLPLSDIISIRKGAFSTCDFIIGDTAGAGLTLRASDEEVASRWVETLMLTKNELLDAVRQLGQNDSCSPHITQISAHDVDSIGPYDIIIAQDISYRQKIQLPYLSEATSSYVQVQLNIGKFKISGQELYDPKGIEYDKNDDGDSNDEFGDKDESQFWIKAMKTNGNSKQLLIRLKVVPTKHTCTLASIQLLSFLGWLKESPFLANSETFPPPIARLFSFIISNPLFGKAPILFSVAIGLFAIALVRVNRIGHLGEFVVLAAIASFTSVLSLVLFLKGSYMKRIVKCFSLEITDFTWVKEEASKEGSTKKLKASSGPPDRFIRMVRGDVDTAQQWWDKTKKWRRANKPERLLSEVPQVHYSKIKECITHYLHKRDRTGRLVYYEVLDSPRKAFRILKEKGCCLEDVVKHMMFCNEFCYRTLLNDYDEEGVTPQASGQLIKVMDIQNLGLGDIGGDVSTYFNLVGAMGKHYPERMDKIFIINVPAAFGMIWNVVAPLLDRNVRERISIFRSNYQDALFELIDPENVPVQYGGQCTCGGESCRYHSPEELIMAEHVQYIKETLAEPTKE